MRKVWLFALSILLFSFLTRGIFAQSLSPTRKPSPTITPGNPQESQELKTIEKIKDLVASKVAELKLVERKGILGTVKSVSNMQIVAEKKADEQRVIDIDELTKFQLSSNKDSFGISDIKEGDFLSVIGLYNKDTKRLLARFISKISSIPENIEGAVIEKDSREFIITIITSEGKKKNVDIQTSTRTSSYDKAKVTKSGFSKIEIGQRVVVVGFKDPKIKDSINASRIIQFPAMPLSSGMKKFSDLTTDEIPASTGSAGKVMPITR